MLRWWHEGGAGSTLTSISLGQDGLVDLRTLTSRPLPCTVELVGVLSAFRPSYSFTSKDGKELVKREITVADDSGMCMVVTLWGDRAKQEDRVFENQPLVWIKGVVVKEWNGGRSGSMLEGGALVFNPSTNEAEKVKAWWSAGGSTQALTSLSQEGGGGGVRGATGKASTLEAMRQAAVQVTAGAGEVFSVVCRLALVQTKKQGETQALYFAACQEPKAGSSLPCNRRLDASGYCAACGRAGKSSIRLNIRCRFSDFTDSAWLTTFHEAAQRVLELSAEEVKAIEADKGREVLEQMIRKRCFQQPIQAVVRAKLDTYNGEVRPNITCIEARPVQRGLHARSMLAEIKEMLASTMEAASTGGA